MNFTLLPIGRLFLPFGSPFAAKGREFASGRILKSLISLELREVEFPRIEQYQ
jgi:hypothetical protein